MMEGNFKDLQQKIILHVYKSLYSWKKKRNRIREGPKWKYSIAGRVCALLPAEQGLIMASHMVPKAPAEVILEHYQV